MFLTRVTHEKEDNNKMADNEEYSSTKTALFNEVHVVLHICLVFDE